jgi:hypothetical protein
VFCAYVTGDLIAEAVFERESARFVKSCSARRVRHQVRVASRGNEEFLRASHPLKAIPLHTNANLLSRLHRSQGLKKSKAKSKQKNCIPSISIPTPSPQLNGTQQRGNFLSGNFYLED